ncbi:MAG: hypothetical protein A2X84_04335 [Desulfuromonadaceae bacterium GWC2_58_13]|nr:MAG: hypothetical protein A2X84_04335 [Desulfuromonadaceae bacterium GWC2_58_13]
MTQFDVREDFFQMLAVAHEFAGVLRPQGQHPDAEGLVPPAEYAGAQGKTTDEVTALMEKEGTLFALCYGDLCLVPMPEREVVLPEIEG